MGNGTIPVVDLSKFIHGSAEERDAFVQKLGHAFVDVGFVVVSNHGISNELVDRFYALAKEFFAKDDAIKVENVAVRPSIVLLNSTD